MNRAPRKLEYCDDCWARARRLDPDNPTPDGWIYVRQPDGQRAVTACECRQSAIKDDRLKRLMRPIPRKHRMAHFDRPPIMNMPAAIQDRLHGYLKDLVDAKRHGDPGEGLWLAGNVGTGKTAAAAMIAREAHNAGLKVTWHGLTRLLWEFQETYDPDDRSGVRVQDMVDNLAGYDLLVLDDVGIPRGTDWALEALWELFNKLYENERSIVITTNLTEHQLDARYNEAIGSRLSELCGQPLVIPGWDLRRPHLAPPPEVEPTVLALASDRTEA